MTVYFEFRRYNLTLISRVHGEQVCSVISIGNWTKFLSVRIRIHRCLFRGLLAGTGPRNLWLPLWIKISVVKCVIDVFIQWQFLNSVTKRTSTGNISMAFALQRKTEWKLWSFLLFQKCPVSLTTSLTWRNTLMTYTTLVLITKK